MRYIWGNMEVRALESESSLVVNLKGVLDTSNARDLENYFNTRIAAGYQKFLLDCSALESLSSGGISFLIRLADRMKMEPGLVFVLTATNSEVTRLLRFFGLESKLTVYSNSAEAKIYLSKVPRMRNRDSNPKANYGHSNSEKTREDGLSYSSGKDLKNRNASSQYPERIRFYYKGQIPRYSQPNEERKNRPSRIASSADKNSESIEPVSTLEPIQENSGINLGSNSAQSGLESKNFIKQEDLMDRLESKMAELKSAIHESGVDLEKKILGQIEFKFKNSPSIKASSHDSHLDPDTDSALDFDLKNSTEISRDQKSSGIDSHAILQRRKMLPVEVIFCGSCNASLRVSKVGKYKCPYCMARFLYSGKGSTSFTEKLT
ncbi:STAS domain-containing protein [Leptospira sp. GIMC2001]|uniref:STAS domain-containing protein n=1 Tax=Leptospira sp. GIMC2001 TaxID=1513297 RepID=UPI002349246E|nr:STAS domain-containing protein [Leptospira sp. GIMC2001]WCL50534.1 STAS domain-containing protein [Leptospira sp. GIMC2001]